MRLLFFAFVHKKMISEWTHRKVRKPPHLHTVYTGLKRKKVFVSSRKKGLQFCPIDVIFNLVENIGLNKIGTRIHSGHGYVARDYSLGK